MMFPRSPVEAGITSADSSSRSSSSVFARNPDRILSKELLHESIWNGCNDPNTNSIYVHIHELRSVIEDDPARPTYRQTVRGVGFVFRPAGS